MAKRYIYGTNRALTKYQFLIESETDTEYNVVDVDMRAYDANYKVDKKTLKFTAIDKQWQFVVDENDFFASFDKNEIIQKTKYYAIENIEHSLQIYKERLQTIETSINNFVHVEKCNPTIDDFYNLNVGDKIILLYKKEKQFATLTHFITTDKKSFTPIFSFQFYDKYDDFVGFNDGKLRLNWENKITIRDEENDDWDIYLNDKHLDYIQNVEQYNNLLSQKNNYESKIKTCEKECSKLKTELNLI